MTPAPQKPKGNGCLTGCGTLFLIIIVIGVIGNLAKAPETAKTPEQQKQEKLEQQNKWYDQISPISCERSLKDDLRNPDSYKRSSDFITTRDNGKEKEVQWKFRAENGFGGMNIGIATCSIEKRNGGEYQVTHTNQ